MIDIASFKIVFDIIVVVLFSLCIISGYRKGLLRSFLSLFSTIISFGFACFFSNVLASKIVIFHISDSIPFLSTIAAPLLTFVNQIVWFLLLFVGVKLILSIIDLIIRMIRDVLFDVNGSLLGAVFGAIEAFIWCAAFSIFLSLPLFKGGETVIAESFLGPIRSISETCLSSFEFNPIQQAEEMSQTMKKIQTLIDSSERFMENTIPSVLPNAEEIKEVFETLPEETKEAIRNSMDGMKQQSDSAGSIKQWIKDKAAELQ